MKPFSVLLPFILSTSISAELGKGFPATCTDVRFRLWSKLSARCVGDDGLVQEASTVDLRWCGGRTSTGHPKVGYLASSPPTIQFILTFLSALAGKTHAHPVWSLN